MHIHSNLQLVAPSDSGTTGATIHSSLASSECAAEVKDKPRQKY